MTNLATLIRKQGIPVMPILLIALVSAVLLYSVMRIKSEVAAGDAENESYFGRIELVNEIRTQVSNLTLWQQQFIIQSEPDQRYLAHRRCNDISLKLPLLCDSLSRVNPFDTLNIHHLIISVSQLIEADEQILNRVSQPSTRVEINNLSVDYRSILDIVSFHLSTVQENLMEVEGQRASDRFRTLALHLLLELILLAGIVGTLTVSIFARRRAEDRLADTQSYLNSIINSMPSALVGISPDCRTVVLNKTAETLCAKPLDTCIGRSVHEILPFLEPKCHMFTDAIHRGIVLEERGIHHRVDGVEKIYDLTLFPLVAGAQSGSVIRIDDVTHERDMENQLRHTQKMNAVGQLAGGIAHDFNNMLGGIIAAAEGMPYCADEQSRQRFLDIIISASSRAADLTRKMLTFARKNNRNISSIDVHEAIVSSVALLEHSLDRLINIVVHLDSSLHILAADMSEMQNVFLNLGINAGHAMKSGGSLTISTTTVELDEYDSLLQRFDISAGAYIRIDVCDTGTGMSPIVIEHIFEPFFTTKETGTGMGLASVYGSVQDYHGAITVSSTPGKGTCFSLYFPPLLSLTSLSSDKSIEEVSLLKGKGTILLVDDEPVIRETAKMLLNGMGYKVIEAENGREGVEIYQQNTDTIDLIILDMIMPEMSGRDAFDAIRILSPDVPIVLSSGFSITSDIEAMRSNNLQAIITKPYRRHELGKVVSDWIRK